MALDPLDEILTPGNGRFAYEDLPEIQEALGVYAAGRGSLIEQAKAVIADGLPPIRLKLHSTMLRVSREQLIDARRRRDVPAAATARQEICDLEHLITQNGAPIP